MSTSLTSSSNKNVKKLTPATSAGAVIRRLAISAGRRTLPWLERVRDGEIGDVIVRRDGTVETVPASLSARLRAAQVIATMTVAAGATERSQGTSTPYTRVVFLRGCQNNDTSSVVVDAPREGGLTTDARAGEGVYLNASVQNSVITTRNSETDDISDDKVAI